MADFELADAAAIRSQAASIGDTAVDASTGKKYVLKSQMNASSTQALLKGVSGVWERVVINDVTSADKKLLVVQGTNTSHILTTTSHSARTILYSAETTIVLPATLPVGFYCNIVNQSSAKLTVEIHNMSPAKFHRSEAKTQEIGPYETAGIVRISIGFFVCVVG